MPELIKAVEELDWTYALAFSSLFLEFLNALCSLPTAIQAEAIPLILGGGDVLAVRVLALESCTML